MKVKQNKKVCCFFADRKSGKLGGRSRDQIKKIQLVTVPCQGRWRGIKREEKVFSRLASWVRASSSETQTLQLCYRFLRGKNTGEIE